MKLRLTNDSSLSDLAYQFQRLDSVHIFAVSNERLIIYESIDDLPEDLIYQGNISHPNGEEWYLAKTQTKQYYFFDPRVVAAMNQKIDPETIGVTVIIETNLCPLPDSRYLCDLDPWFSLKPEKKPSSRPIG